MAIRYLASALTAFLTLVSMAAAEMTVEGTFATAVGDEPAQLIVTARLAPGWHTYSVTQPAGGPVRTKITLDESPQYKLLGAFTPLTPPKAHPEEAFGGLICEEHSGEVIWVAPLELAPEVDPKSLVIRGKVWAQLCDAKGCIAPANYPFEARLGARVIAPGAAAAATPSTTPQGPEAAPSEGARARQGGFDLDQIVVQTNRIPMAKAMLFAFLGGFVLNFMPCVLPVIGLKILTFVTQSGESRARVLLLNLTYATGLMAVFLVLATCAAVFQWSWGQQATYASFNIALAAVVFVMGLSFLGIWEIPVPGFLGRGAAASAADREGYLGAFLKGCITTVLAVPCTGPFLSSALTWAFGQPTYLIYAVFVCIGLGMALPYLVLGLYPGLVKALPKPGPWMETFRQLMAFVLFGTVVYLLTILPPEQVVPTVALLFGLWAAFWWGGRTPQTAPVAKQFTAWAQAGVIALAAGWVAFDWMQAKDDPDRLAWQPYTAARLSELAGEGRTVLVDFTADWCVTCQFVERTVLDTRATKQRVEEQGIVPLVADYTDGSEEISQMLERLGSKQIPKLAIFPADDPAHPIVLDGVYTRAQLFEALDRAGPSLKGAGVEKTASISAP